jgi:hypothetical protein
MWFKLPTEDAPQVDPMPSFLAVPGLRFNDCYFSEPVPLASWAPPNCAGLLVVVVRDVRWAPKPFRPLYFGEFGNDAHPAPASRGWLHTDAGHLYVAALPLPFSTSTQRRALRNELVSAYNPVCQAAASPSADELARKMEDLEARQQEQNAQILKLLSGIARLFEPQPVGPSRPIGFRPQFVPLAAQSES